MREEPVLGGAATTAAAEQTFSVLIVSAVRFLREAVAEIIRSHQAFLIAGVAGDLAEGSAIALERQPDIVLLDAAFPNGAAAVGRMRAAVPQATVVVLAVAESDERVVAWAEAGASGYIPSAAAPGDLAPFLKAIMRGEQPCSERAAARLLRRMASGEHTSGARAMRSERSVLTAREAQIVRLIDAGLSNKEIARRLNIEVATTKSHVHNLLGKLDLQRRGQVSLWVRAHQRALLPSPSSSGNFDRY